MSLCLLVRGKLNSLETFNLTISERHRLSLEEFQRGVRAAAENPGFLN